jgi:hypothetical protein
MITPRTDARLDQRLLSAGHSLTVADLVRLWADHTPPIRPVPGHCRTCGHIYSQRVPLCPTATVVRPLLRRRRHEAGARALERLTSYQTDDLLCPRARLSTALPLREDIA